MLRLRRAAACLATSGFHRAARSVARRAMVPLLSLSAMALAWSLSAKDARAIDTFDQHTSYWLNLAIKNGKPLEAVTSGQAAQWKFIGRDVTQPCVVIKTGDGNVAKALLSWGFRKTADKPVPVLVIDRYVTYDRDRGNLTLAHGRNLMLFPGFEFDFDIGQVVPAGLGGDVALNEKRALVALGEAKIYGLDGSLIPEGEGEVYNPQAHQGVQPRDYAGEWKVTADGRWFGTWALAVDDDGNIEGQYLSEETKSVFPLKGRVALGEPNRIVFDVEFAAATQHYDLYLFTGDKSAMCGTTTLVDRKFGVLAQRINKDQEAKEAAPGQDGQ